MSFFYGGGFCGHPYRRALEATVYFPKKKSAHRTNKTVFSLSTRDTNETMEKKED